MNELAARIADGWAPDLTPAERAAIETDRDLGLHLSSRREPCTCELCLTVLPALVNRVRKYINAAAPHIEAAERARLAGEGSLHPAGSEHRLQVVFRWFDAAGEKHDRGGPDDFSVEQAREMAAGLPAWAVRWEIRTCEHWDAPWEVVEEGTAG